MSVRASRRGDSRWCRFLLARPDTTSWSAGVCILLVRGLRGFDGGRGLLLRGLEGFEGGWGLLIRGFEGLDGGWGLLLRGLEGLGGGGLEVCGLVWAGFGLLTLEDIGLFEG